LSFQPHLKKISSENFLPIFRQIEEICFQFFKKGFKSFDAADFFINGILSFFNNLHSELWDFL